MSYKRALQALLVVVAGYDIYLAVLGLFFRNDSVTQAASYFNFNLELTTSTYWLIGLLATYLLAFAAFLLLAATNPIKYMNVIYICLGLFLVRIVQRIDFMISASKDTDLLVSPKDANTYLIGIIFVAVALLFLTLKVRKLESNN